MASNLQILVRADTGEARAQLALVNADYRQMSRSLADLAKAAIASGSGVTDAMRQMAAGTEAARAEVAKLKAEMSQGNAGFFSRLNEGIKAPLEGLAQLKSSLRETAEFAGAAFAVDEIRDFAKEMAEAGEKALNTSFVLGISIRQVAELQGVFTLAGGSAEDAQRTFERPGVSVEQAITQIPTVRRPAVFKTSGFRSTK